MLQNVSQSRCGAYTHYPRSQGALGTRIIYTRTLQKGLKCRPREWKSVSYSLRAENKVESPAWEKWRTETGACSMTIVLPILLLTYLMFHGTQLIALHPMILSHETRSLFIIALLPGSSQAPPKISSHTAQYALQYMTKSGKKTEMRLPPNRMRSHSQTPSGMYIASSIECITESNLHLGWFGFGTETKQNAPLLLIKLHGTEQSWEARKTQIHWRKGARTLAPHGCSFVQGVKFSVQTVSRGRAAYRSKEEDRFPGW